MADTQNRVRLADNLAHQRAKQEQRAKYESEGSIDG
jgi:hypothetical protein